MYIRRKYLWTTLFLIISTVVLWADLSHACDYCLLTQGLSPLQTTTGLGIRIDERYTVLNSMYKGTDKVDNPGNKETHLTTQVTGFYAINPDLTALVVIPYVRKTMKEEDGGVFVEGKATGLGDLALMGRYTFYKRHDLASTTLLAGQAGVKLPTGATDKKDDMGDVMDAHIQPGTGSTDLLLGVNLSHATGRFTLATNLLFFINGEGETGDEKHEFGDMLNYDVTGIYRIYPDTPPGPTVSLALGIAGEWRAKEKEDGVDIGINGHVVFLNTGLLFIPGPKWIAELNYRPAIYHDLPVISGGEDQMGEDYKATLSLTHLF
ncbi:MAG TPA: transporter [Nitrospirota bacterium]|nr:transporter [Nitrospirota bacterium]